MASLRGHRPHGASDDAEAAGRIGGLRAHVQRVHADGVLEAIGHVEASAALSRAHRGGHLSSAALADAVRLLDDLWSDITVVPADEPRVRAAAEAALRHSLRGYDAVHCSAALAVASDHTVAAGGDQELLAAWRAEGLAVADTNA